MKTFITPARQNQFVEEHIFNNVPVGRIAIARNANFGKTISHTKNTFWYQQFNFRQIKILSGGQAVVDFAAVDNCRLHVTAMKSMTST